MSALATDTARTILGSKTYAFQIANGSQIYVGSFTSILSGYAQPFAGAAGEMLVGRALPTPRADTPGSNALLGNTGVLPVPEVSVCMEEEVLRAVSCTGVSAITNIGTVVYLNSNDNDLTLTRPARGQPFGVVVRWYTSTTCDVLRFAATELMAINLGGNAGESMLVMSGKITDLTSADFQIMTPPYAGTIQSTSATVVLACTTGATGSVTLTPKIGTTAVTGGVVTINTTGGTGGAAGDVCAGTPVTALNAFSESSVLKMTAVLTSTFTAGSFNLYMKVLRSTGI